MADDRPSKQTVRQSIWLDVVKRRAPARSADVPLYVTLPGAEGFDIQLLVDEGLLALTETGAISEGSKNVVVAIECKSDARAQLLEKFYGLEVLPERFENLIRGRRRIAYPDGRHLSIWRSLVVNLDLNDPLHLTLDHGNLACPLVEHYLVKVATMQREVPHEAGWSLLLTLHGTILVDSKQLTSVCSALAKILDENMKSSEEYATNFAELVGKEADADWLADLCTVKGDADGRNNEEMRQRVILMLVPKLIVEHLTGMGWNVTIGRSAFYGGDKLTCESADMGDRLHPERTSWYCGSNCGVTSFRRRRGVQDRR
ncbi:MAG: hypothetical protein U5R31_16940 [Acidimicrobiia bacterium]|nr:hypothetical protein [Acidimicrobiia bacterium]